MNESMQLKDVYTISEREGGQEAGRERWTRIGIGFVNRDNSINVVLDAIPLSGRLHIRERQAKTKTEHKEGS